MTMIRTRLAPSPTGFLHVGGLRTALYCYLHAKKNGGTFFLRIEDTDQGRFVEGAIENLVKSLHTCGIHPDEGVLFEDGKVIQKGEYGPYIQSERLELYQKHAQELVEKGHAYYCFCTSDRLEAMRKEQIELKRPPMYDRLCLSLSPEEIETKKKEGLSCVIRQKIPRDRTVQFEDIVRGKVRFEGATLDDQVLLKSDGFATYHLAHVVDDHYMKTQPVIRGEEWLPSLPKHLLLFEAFGWEVPQYAHLPLLLNANKTKLSKRDGDVAVEDYLKKGYLPEALINFVVFLGWNPGTEQEIFSFEELIQAFSLDRVHKGGAVFDVKKLDWINGEYIRKMIKEDIDGFYERVKPFIEAEIQNPDAALIKKILQDPDFEGRFKKLSEIPEGLAPLFSELTDYPLELIALAKFNITPDVLKQVMEKAIEKVEAMEWEKGDASKTQLLSDAFVSIVSDLELKNGQVLWPVRVALSGLEKSPNFATLAIYLGKEEVLKRLKLALNKVA